VSRIINREQRQVAPNRTIGVSDQFGRSSSRHDGGIIENNVQVSPIRRAGVKDLFRAILLSANRAQITQK
jgi:hypothetical protein